MKPNVIIFHTRRRFLVRNLFSVLMILVLLQFVSVYGGGWSVYGGAHYMNGNYIYTSTVNTFYLNGGLRYQAGRWNAALNVPLIIQNNELVSSSGGMMLPSHGGLSGDETGGGHHGGGMMNDGRINTDGIESRYELGPGDAYLSVQFQFLREMKKLPSIAVTSQIKFPTAGKFGTGAYDLGITGNFSKRFGNYAGFFDAGYWLLGDSPEINYQNPLAYGAGIGRFFSGGKYSALLYYHAYTRILPDYEPPRQASLGLYYLMNFDTVFSITIYRGFSNTSAGFGLSAGFNKTL